MTSIELRKTTIQERKDALEKVRIMKAGFAALPLALRNSVHGVWTFMDALGEEFGPQLTCQCCGAEQEREYWWKDPHGFPAPNHLVQE